MKIPFDINGNNVDAFEETDPFNNDNKIKGFIYRNADMKYGCEYKGKPKKVGK